MEVIITGANFDIGASLREHVKEKLILLSKKFNEDKIHKFHVIFSKEGISFVAKIDVIEEIDSKSVLNVSHCASDAYVSFDFAIKKLEEQFRKNKEKLVKMRKHTGVLVKEEQNAIAEDGIDETYTILGDDEETITLK